MNGILLVNKEKNMTSHDVVNKIRRIFNIKKVGHVGTLDPISTGVLVVLLGNATKLAPFLENDSKEYIASIRFGFSTDTYDITGKIIEQYDEFLVDVDSLDNILNDIIGIQEQRPPIYSAVKVAGKKLYEYARSNKTVDIPTRQVEVYKAERISEISNNEYTSCDVVFNVSKGTYIRSIIEEIGKRIGIPCCMEGLTRTRSGNFLIENAYSLNDIKIGNFQLINPLEILEMPIINVDNNSEIYKKSINGMKISPNIFEEKPNKFAVSCDNKLIAIYELCSNEIPHYKSIRVWND